MTMPAGGLGRGLSTILTGSSAAPPSPRTIVDHLVERALTEMASRGPLRVCGHVDDPLGAAALTLRSPDLGSLHPTEAYQLFSAIHGVDARSPGRHDLDLGSLRAMAVVVAAADSRGLWFFGDDRLDDTEIERLAQLSEAYGPAVCDHRPAAADADPISVHLTGSDTAWSAEIRHLGDGVEGDARGTGLRPIDAAVAAVCAATGVSAARTEVDLVRAEDATAVVVVVRLGALVGAGAAEVATTGDAAAEATAAATATRRATYRLR